MSSSEINMVPKSKSLTDDRDNDPFSLLERAADIIWERSKEAVADGNS